MWWGGVYAHLIGLHPSPSKSSILMATLVSRRLYAPFYRALLRLGVPQKVLQLPLQEGNQAERTQSLSNWVNLISVVHGSSVWGLGRREGRQRAAPQRAWKLWSWVRRCDRTGSAGLNLALSSCECSVMTCWWQKMHPYLLLHPLDLP